MNGLLNGLISGINNGIIHGIINGILNGLLNGLINNLFINKLVVDELMEYGIRIRISDIRISRISLTLHETERASTRASHDRLLLFDWVL